MYRIRCSNINFQSLQVLRNHTTGEVDSCVTKDGHEVLRTVCGDPPNVDVYHFETSGIVGNGSFGVVFEAKCLETAETVSNRLWLNHWALSTIHALMQYIPVV